MHRGRRSWASTVRNSVILNNQLDGASPISIRKFPNSTTKAYKKDTHTRYINSWDYERTISAKGEGCMYSGIKQRRAKSALVYIPWFKHVPICMKKFTTFVTQQHSTSISGDSATTYCTGLDGAYQATETLCLSRTALTNSQESRSAQRYWQCQTKLSSMHSSTGKTFAFCQHHPSSNTSDSSRKSFL